MASGRLGNGLNGENGRRRLHFIGEEREPGMEEGGMVTGNTAGSHGKRPERTRPFQAIECAIQRVNWGELKRID